MSFHHPSLIIRLFFLVMTAVVGGQAGSFAKVAEPLLRTHCYACHGNGKHKGDVALDAWKDEATRLADRKLWERVQDMLQNRQMPPENKPQPTDAERQILLDWIEKEVFHCDCTKPDPGRVTLRRLNRTEYNHTVRDLLGIDFRPADDFPVDDSGHGFDNIGDALSMPPILVEKYLAAAETILEDALPLREAAVAQVRRYPVDLLEVGYNAKQRGDGWVGLNSIEEDDVAVVHRGAHPGEYAVRVKAYARKESTNELKLTFMLDDTPVKVVTVETNAATPQIYEARMSVPRGSHRLRAVVRRIKDGLPEAEALKWKSGPLQPGTVYVEFMEIDGPLFIPPAEQTTRGKEHKPLITAAERLFANPPSAARHSSTARKYLEDFAMHAFRRPPTRAEMDRLMQVVSGTWTAGEAFDAGMRLGMQALLVSPHFLFRGELQPEPDNPARAHPINDWALASRLSYFLWSTMPDAELFAEARRGTLRRNLERQVRRMLKSPNATALVDHFAGQWLQIRNLDRIEPDQELFPEFDEPLRAAMKRETELLFETVLREDLSVLEFARADFTFVNERLARHYGLAGVRGEEFQRVSLRNTPRRGVLSHASVLTLTSNPTRTSPVKRGKWVLDNLLNAPPPPPPPEVPELKDAGELTGTLRQRMERHRANPSCAGCHARMDPLGFGLENFNAIGGWRTAEGDSPVDASGEFTTGEKFTGARDLAALLAGRKQEQFVRCVAGKLLTYALGRGLEYYDKCALDSIVKDLQRGDFRFSTLVLGIVKSTPFQMRRGEAGGTSR